MENYNNFSTFNAFEDNPSENLTVDVTAYIDILKKNFFAFFGSIGLIAVFSAYGQDIRFSFSDIGSYFPIFVAAAFLVALAKYGFKYFAYLDSFSSPNLVVLSSEGITAPAFLLGSHDLFKKLVSSSLEKSPFIMKWSKIENIDYAPNRRGDGKALKIQYHDRNSMPIYIHLGKTCLKERFEEVERFLKENHPEKFLRHEINFKRGVLWFAKLVLISVAILAALIAFFFHMMNKQ